MKNEHQIYLISDSTGETIDRIFAALRAQFSNFEYELNHFSFTRTENQIQKILENAKKKKVQLYYIQLLIVNLLNTCQMNPKKNKYHALGFWVI